MTEATIFIAALDKPNEAERAAFLADACAGDLRLRRRVLALLRAHAEPDDILDRTSDQLEAPGATSPSAPGGEQAGALVAGRYKLLEAIGEGGMGTVWMAEQREPVKRLVALKLSMPGMDSKAVLARFEAERQALALMDHSSIAKILDGGTTRDEPGGVGPGRPYFVIAQQKRAVAIRRQELGAEHSETVGAMNDLAIVLSQMGTFAEGQKILEEVVAVKRRTLGPEDPVTLRSANNLAIALAMQGLTEDAVKLVEETLEIQRRVEGPESITTLRSTYNLAIRQPYLGRWAEARPLFDESLQTLRRVFGPDHQDLLRVLNSLGELLLDQRRPAAARALFEEAQKGQQRVLGPTSEETLLTMINLADTARLQGRLDEARKLAEEADGLFRRTIGSEHPQTLLGLTILSSIARDQGHLDQAREGYEKALAALRRTLSARNPEVQKCMVDYAWMLTATADPGYRDPRRAIEMANELIQNSPKVRDVWTTLGVAHFRAGAWNDAIAALEKSETVAPGLFTSPPPTASSWRWLTDNSEKRKRGANGTRRP